MFAVFILKNNEWMLHWNVGADRSAGEIEVTYLTNCGVTARLFVREN